MLRLGGLVLITVIFFHLTVHVESAAIIRAPKEGNLDWWKHAVFYQIYPRSFKDSDNDGIGDIKGITSKLQHLKDAGVTATWLSPIYKSPQFDQGYDISDFKDIDEDYGTLEDFDEMLKKAHDLGIKIIMDFVPNHSSDQHEWFIKSAKKEPGFEDFYIWSDGKNGGPPNNWISVFQNSAWKYNEERKQFYYHAFAAEQPDLNYRNDKVVAEMKNVLEFWLDKGVDGFRMDAVPYLFENDKLQDEPTSGNPNVGENEYGFLNHIHTTDQPQTYDMIYQWRAYLDDYTERKGGDARVMMTEAYTSIENTMLYYGNNENKVAGAHFSFNFLFITKLNKMSSASDIISVINEWLDHMPEEYTANWVLGNHDNHRVATRFGPERVDGMNMLTALLPGVMVTYNGEEIGQENGKVTWEQGHDPSACDGNSEHFDKTSRDFERTPFHWDGTTNAGFNKGGTPWLPVSEKYKETNLAAQSIPGTQSHYHIYQKLLKLRQELVFTKGALFLKALSDKVVAFTREGSDGTVYVVVINIGDKEEMVDLSPFEAVKKNVKVVAANTGSYKHDRVLSSNNIVLTAYESIVAQALPDVEEGDADWWKHAVFYQIYPRSFKDDNNDGIGDLKGIISKLEHLKDAGVTATWLSPIYKSPQVDQGYDISDFKDIDEDYGTLEDFDNLLRKAHDLGIKIVMDFVPNHSSDQHEWFTKSENREAGYEDYYVWKDGKGDEPPNNWLSNFKYSAWKFSEKRQQYYLHQFAEEQPDLNYRSPLLVQEMKGVLKFWLDRGVDGFRMDAVPYLFEDEKFEDEPLSENPNVNEEEYGYLKHIYTSDRPETYDMIHQWRNYVDDYTKEHGGDARIMMTEAYTDIKHTMLYYGNETHEGAHFTFNFQMITNLDANSNARNIVLNVKEWLTYMPPRYTANWVLGNHDNHRVATRFGPERVDGMNMLTALLPGIMVTYNGEEIGQENGKVTWAQGEDPRACNGKPEDFDKTSRDFERTPFHWDGTTNAGFNTGHEPWLPVSEKYMETNLAAQTIPGTQTHYHTYQKLLKLRQEPVFANGALNLTALSDNVLAFSREGSDGSAYVVVINIGNKEESVDVSSFKGLKKNVKVVVANPGSYKHDRVLSSNNIVLTAYESIVAKALPDVEEGQADWWKQAVFYQIYPRSFKDNNNDGIGDLKGIISKLEHLKDAGVTATWLSPIYKSPQVDQGYDISDFKDIDEEYGTLEDFDNLLEKAHKLGIKIVMDFVPNHSSDQHEWFTKSENREAGYEDYYVWKDGKGDEPPNNWLSIFKYSAWKFSAKRKQYYLHQFAEQQPDLNYRSPLLVQEMKDVLKFWLDRGVDGFRMDAVPYLFEDEKFEDEPPSENPNVNENEHGYLKHIYTSDQPGTYDMIHQWRNYVDDYTKEHGGDARIMMTEAYTDIEHTMLYYGNDTHEGAHFTFNFQMITKLNSNSNAKDVVAAIKEWNQYMPSRYTANWVIGNHDNHRVASRFGSENVDGFNMLTALLPGVMVTYNGEEIGQENGKVTWAQGQDPSACNGKPEDFDKTSRDFERTPFHWDDSTNAGFNTGHEPWLPVSEKYKETNLAAQSIPDTQSHYHTYQTLLKLRQEPVFVNGALNINALSDNVVAFTREGLDGTVHVVVINIGNKEEIVDLSTFEAVKKNVKVVVANAGSYKHDRVLSSNNIVMAAYESIVAKALPDVEEGDADWWKHAVFYQIYPRSFKDDNNDGIGDLKGIISKLEHLKDAGVTATWLSPIYKSPQVDQGYDISDFKDIDEDYGTLEDFDNLLRKAHELGIKIVMDFVPNHSSDKHEWFTKSENRDPGYEDYYVWKDGKGDKPPNNWLSIFKYSAWKFSEKRKQYYLHQFAEEQPDLNYRSPLLVQEMKDVLKFWLDRGVDGFRMDAVPYIFEDEKFEDEPLSGKPNVNENEHGYLKHIYTSDQPGTYDMIHQWRNYVDDYTKEHGGDARIMMTEAYTDIKHTMLYYGNETHEGAHFTFNFQMITNLDASSNARNIVINVKEWLTYMPPRYTANWVLGNHDNHRVATRFGPERVDGMNMLTALLPGVMVTYNGEEIGQENGKVTWAQGKDPSACNGKPEDFDKTSRDFERTPFHWDDSTNAGFNTGHEAWLPVSEKYKETNLAAQSIPGTQSHYHTYQKILKLRQEPMFANGALNLTALSDNVLAFSREGSDGSVYVVVINVGNKEESVDISSFKGLKKNVKVVIANPGSYKHDRVLSSNNIVLTAYESIVTQALPDVEEGDADWWKHAVFYQIYPRSFKDDNNDGIGDLKGIISKLEHLKDAGVTATWLSPIYKSPQIDQGYDISDFKDIDEEYGTLEDFDNLLRKAHELGIKIVMDFVPNHSSDQHEWFTKSENREPGYEDYYVWKDGKADKPPNNWLSIFKYSAWKFSEKRKQYYLHQFAEEQPDLNYRSPLLVQEMKDVLKFWLDRGVDGFRMDAVPYVFEDEKFEDEPLSGNPNVNENEHGYLKHIYTSDQPGTYDMIHQWRNYVDDYTQEHGGDARIMMTEAYTDIEHTMLYYGNDTHEGAHFTFNFQMITKLNKNSNAKDVVAAIKEWNQYMPSRYTANWVIGNHDNHRAASRFGPENADGFNMLTALLPGVMVTYNGEEIGQENGKVTWAQGQDPSACNGKPEDFDKTSRDFERTPFHWDGTTNAGFNKGGKPWLPVSEKYKETNLAAQKDSTTLSHYQIYKLLLEFRSQPALIDGTLEIEAISDNVLGYSRNLEGNPTYVFLFNMGSEAATVDISSSFTKITPYLEIVLSNNRKFPQQETLLSTEVLTLNAHEGVIAITTSKVGPTPEPTTTEISTTAEPGSAPTSANVTFVTIFMALICAFLFN